MTTAAMMKKRNEIQLCALQLCAVHGFNGFTMDDLAEQLGYSRRTIFNAVGDKHSAVLGVDDAELLEEFLESFYETPMQGSRVLQLFEAFEKFSLVPSLGAGDKERMRLLKTVVADDPKLQQVLNERNRLNGERLQQAFAKHIGFASNSVEMELLAKIYATCFDQILEVFFSDEQTSMQDAVFIVKQAYIAVH